MRYNIRNTKMEVYKCLHQKSRKKRLKQPNNVPQGTRKAKIKQTQNY